MVDLWGIVCDPEDIWNELIKEWFVGHSHLLHFLFLRHLLACNWLHRYRCHCFVLLLLIVWDNHFRLDYLSCWIAYLLWCCQVCWNCMVRLIDQFRLLILLKSFEGFTFFLFLLLFGSEIDDVLSWHWIPFFWLTSLQLLKPLSPCMILFNLSLVFFGQLRCLLILLSE